MVGTNISGSNVTTGMLSTAMLNANLADGTIAGAKVSPDFQMLQWKQFSWAPLICLGILDFLFIFKYSSQPPHSLAIALAGTFSILAVFIAADIFLSRIRIAPLKKHNIYYYAAIAALSLGYIVVLFQIDRQNVAVDRWSALEYFIRELLNGRFPYAVPTHVSTAEIVNTPSPFPVMYVLAFPFYMLGDVGYLQVGAFIAFSCMLLQWHQNHKNRIMIFLMMLSCPAWLWEVAVRSDLFVCLLLPVPVVFLAMSLKENRAWRATIAIAALSGLVLNTRSITIIPLITGLFCFYRCRSAKHLLVSLAIIGFMTMIFFAPFYFWDKELFFRYSPLFLQTNKAPLWLSALLVIASAAAGFKCSSAYQAFYFAGILLFCMIGVNFIIRITEYGFINTIYHDKFDISYFNMALPYLLLAISKKNNFIVPAAKAPG